MGLESARRQLARRPTTGFHTWIIRLGLPPALAFSAVLMAISVGAPGHSGLAWIGLLPLLAAVRVLSPCSATLAGAAWGLVFYFAAVLGFAPGVSHGFGALVLVALVPAVYTLLGALATRALGFVPVIMALLWILAEVALQPLGLRCGLLAGTQGDGNFASYVAGLLGYVFVASAIVYANAWLLVLIIRLRWAQPVEALSSVLTVVARWGHHPVAIPVRMPAHTQGFPRAPPIR